MNLKSKACSLLGIVSLFLAACTSTSPEQEALDFLYRYMPLSDSVDYNRAYWERCQKFLDGAIQMLKPNGRLAVISFHSLEDRIVKQTFKRAATDCVCPPKIPQCICHHQATVKLLTKKPICPTIEETISNPRSSSAKLRVICKL